VTDKVVPVTIAPPIEPVTGQHSADGAIVQLNKLPTNVVNCICGRACKGQRGLKAHQSSCKTAADLDTDKLLNETYTAVEDGLEEGVYGKKDSSVVIVARDGCSEEGVH